MSGAICSNPNAPLLWHYYYLIWGEQKNRIFHWLPLDKAQEWHLVSFLIFPYGALTSGGSQIDCMYLQNVCKLGDNFTRKFISGSPGSSYFKGLFYQKQGVSCFDLVPGHCTASCVLSPSNVCFKVVNSFSLLHKKMHVLSVMGKQISAKYFNSFQCLKCQVKWHKLIMLEPSKGGQKMMSQTFSGN